MICETVSAPSLPESVAVSAEIATPSPALADYSTRIGQVVTTMRAQAAGILKLLVVDADTWTQLVANRAHATPAEALAFSLAADALAGRHEGRPDALARCAKCEGPLRNGEFQLVIAYPDHPVPDAGLTVPVCIGCAVARSEAQAVTWSVLEPLFGPIRVFAPMPDTVGHA